MPKRILTPKQSLLKGYMILPVSKEAVSVFKEEMRTLADRIKTEESEEYNKTSSCNSLIAPITPSSLLSTSTARSASPQHSARLSRGRR